MRSHIHRNPAMLHVRFSLRTAATRHPKWLLPRHPPPNRLHFLRFAQWSRQRFYDENLHRPGVKRTGPWCSGNGSSSSMRMSTQRRTQYEYQLNGSAYKYMYISKYDVIVERSQDTPVRGQAHALIFGSSKLEHYDT